MKQRIILLLSFVLIVTGCGDTANNTVDLSDYQQKKTLQDFRHFDYSQYSDEQFSLRVHEISSLPSGVIFLGGSYRDSANTIHTALLVSRDGGVTWKDAGIKFRGCGIMNFQTFGLEHVWAISTFLQEGCNSPESLLYSADAGQNWLSIPMDFIQMEGLAWVQQFQFYDENNGLIVIRNSLHCSKVFTTADGGRNWEKVMTSKNDRQYDIEIERYGQNYSRGNINKAALWKKSPHYYKISGWIRVRKTDSINDPYISIESQSVNGEDWKEISQITKYYKIQKNKIIPQPEICQSDFEKL